MGDCGRTNAKNSTRMPRESCSLPDSNTDHPRTSRDLFRIVDFPSDIAEIVYQHHERLDGSEYPQGLSGAEILIESRILAVSDVVRAMSSHRHYRAALRIEAALAEI